MTVTTEHPAFTLTTEGLVADGELFIPGQQMADRAQVTRIQGVDDFVEVTVTLYGRSITLDVPPGWSGGEITQATRDA